MTDRHRWVGRHSPLARHDSARQHHSGFGQRFGQVVRHLLLRLYFDKSHDAVLNKLPLNINVLAAQVHGLVVHRRLDARNIVLKDCCRPVLRKAYLTNNCDFATANAGTIPLALKRRECYDLDLAAGPLRRLLRRLASARTQAPTLLLSSESEA